MLPFQKTTVERAFELARSGSCKDLKEIRRQLQQEKFSRVNEHLAGKQVRHELRRLCEDVGNTSAAPLSSA